jgi:SAM-dependent methyltransferase
MNAPEDGWTILYLGTVRILESVDRAVHRRFNRHVMHLTPRYVVDRVRRILFSRLHPDLPWLNAQAVRVLERELGPTDTGIEWGAGRSTLWLARRTASLRSVESDGSWYERVAGDLRRSGVENARLVHVDLAEGESEGLDAYVNAYPELEDESLTYALVDGLRLSRESCALRAVRLLAPGGLLVFDDATWWIPHPTRTPFKPSAPSTPLAEQLVEVLEGWPVEWTTDGITDTAFWRKPRSAGG